MLDHFSSAFRIRYMPKNNTLLDLEWLYGQILNSQWPGLIWLEAWSILNLSDIKKAKGAMYWLGRRGLSSFSIWKFPIIFTFRNTTKLQPCSVKATLAMHRVCDEKSPEQLPLDLPFSTDCLQWVCQFSKWKHWPHKLRYKEGTIQKRKWPVGKMAVGVKRPRGFGN